MHSAASQKYALVKMAHMHTISFCLMLSKTWFVDHLTNKYSFYHKFSGAHLLLKTKEFYLPPYLWLHKCTLFCATLNHDPAVIETATIFLLDCFSQFAIGRRLYCSC